MNQKTMKALVWIGPSEMVFKEVPVPNPGTGEVLVEVDAVGICGSELSGFLGKNSLRVPPLIMGHEFSGKIVADAGASLAGGSVASAGSRVVANPLVSCGQCQRCRTGQVNLCPTRRLLGAHQAGAFARWVSVPAHCCYPLSDHTSAVIGSLAEPLACSIRAVRLARLSEKDRLLILGAGPIGLFCLRAAREMGISSITVTDVSESRLAIANRWGADRTLVAGAQGLEQGSVEAVIDAVGLTQTRDEGIKMVRSGGRVVFIGLHHEASVLPVNYLIRQEISIAGCFAYTRDDFETALRMLETGSVQPSPDWLEERPLSDGARAFEQLVAGTVPQAKIVLRP